MTYLVVMCRRAGCWGTLAAEEPAAVRAWSDGHDAECPVPAPPGAEWLVGKLLDLEEADDPDQDVWERRVREEIIPLVRQTLAESTSALQQALGTVRGDVISAYDLLGRHAAIASPVPVAAGGER